MYLIAGVYEREGPLVHNTAVLMDRGGSSPASTGRCACPARRSMGASRPARPIPSSTRTSAASAFMICWDLSFPEVSREIARRGAEVIFLPIWGGTRS